MSSNADFDLASMREEQEREAAIFAARAVISSPGSNICVDCDEPISEERRLAVPFARRCVGCQTILEQEKYHR